MICNSYILFVCPDPECDYWDIDNPIGGHCPNYDAHPLGDYPKMMELRVTPAPRELLAYRLKHA